MVPAAAENPRWQSAWERDTACRCSIWIPCISCPAGWSGPFAEEEAIVRQFLDENAGGWVIDGNYTKTCYARRLEEADKIIVLWFSPLVCLWRAVRRWQQNKGRVRESSAPGCEEKIDAEFVRWILHDGRTKQKWVQMERIGEKYPENYILIRNQRELDGFLKEL